MSKNMSKKMSNNMSNNMSKKKLNNIVAYYSTSKSNSYIDNCMNLGKNYTTNKSKKIINNLFNHQSNRAKCEIFGTAMRGKVAVLKPLFEI